MQVHTLCLTSGSPQIRLMNGNNRCEGRVEILQQRSWGTICHFLWDLKDAHVVCRELSCGVAVEAKNSAFFGEGSGPIWRSGLQCTGDESQLMKCGHFADIVQYCGHRHDAGVICSGRSAYFLLGRRIERFWRKLRIKNKRLRGQPIDLTYQISR